MNIDVDPLMISGLEPAHAMGEQRPLASLPMATGIPGGSEGVVKRGRGRPRKTDSSQGAKKPEKKKLVSLASFWAV